VLNILYSECAGRLSFDFDPMRCFSLLTLIIPFCIRFGCHIRSGACGFILPSSERHGLSSSAVCSVPMSWCSCRVGPLIFFGHSSAVRLIAAIRPMCLLNVSSCC